MQRLRRIYHAIAAIVTPVLLILVVPALALGQAAPIQAEPEPGTDERSYAMQWGLVVLLTLVSFLLLCKPSFRDEKLQKEKKTKRDKGKKDGH